MTDYQIYEARTDRNGDSSKSTIITTDFSSPL